MDRRQVVSKLRFHGLNCGKQSVDAIHSACTNHDDPATCLSAIISAIKKADMAQTRVDADVVEEAIHCVMSGVSADLTPNVTIMGAFDMPRFDYDIVRKTYCKIENGGGSILDGAMARPTAFRERFLLIQTRTQRNPLFSAPVVKGDGSTDNFSLTTIGALKENGEMQRVLGMISQPKEGEFVLEDMTDHIPIDMSAAQVSSGLFTETSIVIAEGLVKAGVLHVRVLAMPPSEDRSVTMRAFPVLGPMPERNGALEDVFAMEKDCPGHQFIFISDVWLDRPKVIQGLRQLFIAYDDVARREEVSCIIFVLCGNFMSVSQPNPAPLEKLMGELGAMVSGHTALLSVASFVFVPGLHDPAAAAVLPRPPLPSSVAQAFQEHVPNSTFTTNPCRLGFLSQEVVVMRDDLCQKMMRNARKPSDDTPVWGQLARTLLDQAHLWPLPPSAAPVYWGFDRSLRLFPAPTLLVVADRVNQCVSSWARCTVANPGSFSADLSFIVYTPATQAVETCQIEEGQE